jgi:hypothetical protein
VVCVYSSHSFSKQHFSEHSSATEQVHSVANVHLSDHTLLVESQITISQLLIVKFAFKIFDVVAKLFNQSIYIIFSQYFFFSNHVIERLQQADIVFPFHYFW